MGAQMAMPPFLVISEATKPTRRINDVAMLLGSPQLRGKMLAHDIAVEQRNRTSAEPKQLDPKDVGDGGLARAGKAGKKHREPLVMPGRMGTLELPANLRKRKPFGKFVALGELPTELSSGQAQCLRPGRYFIFT